MFPEKKRKIKNNHYRSAIQVSFKGHVTIEAVLYAMIFFF